MNTEKTSFRNQVRHYWVLAKGGIVFLVLISVTGGYFAGHPLEEPISWINFFQVLVGVLLLSSGAAAMNQIQEVDLDRQMPRTSKRPLAQNQIPLGRAKIFSITLMGVGLLLLFPLDPWVGAFGCLAVLTYNGLYTLWWKRHWAHGAIPGAIPGALPVLMGYAAASHQPLAPGGIYLFFIQFFWQMPHFWTLAIRYAEDYRKGQIPTLPVAQGTEMTTLKIASWTLAYVALTLIAPLFLPVGVPYLVVAIGMGLKLFWELRRYLKSSEPKAWLKFFLWINFSLIILLAVIDIDLWSIYLWVPFTR